MSTRKIFSLSLVLAGAGICFWAATVQGVDSDRWVRVEAGTFTMGATPETDPIATRDEAPMHEVTLDAFDIGRTEVTVREFAEFIGAGGYTNEAFHPLWDLSALGEPNLFGTWNAPEGWAKQRLHPNRPVTGVSWHEAMVFCRWRSRRDGQRITLPTEAQWERAARGTEGRRFPWGNQIPDGTLELGRGEHLANAADAGSHPDGDTPGTRPISDLGGNALEWCRDRKVSYRTPPRAGDGLRDGPSRGRATRGGSFYHDPRSLRAAGRSANEPRVRTALLGFRLVRSVP